MDNLIKAEDLDTAPCGFIIFTDNGIITCINLTMVSLLGYAQKEELTGKSIESIFTIAGRIFYQTHFFPLIRMHGRAEEIFFKLKGKSKDDIPVICNSVRKEEGGSFYNHCIFFPAFQRGKYEQELLLARKKAEDMLGQNEQLRAAKKELEIHSGALDRRMGQLKQVNEDLVQFGKVISHDLQEPVRKIALFADKMAAENEGKLDSNSISGLRKINDEALRIRHIVASLEKFLTLNLTAEPITKFDLNRLVSKTMSEAMAEEAVTDIIFVADHLPVIAGYQSQVETLFYNIFHNTMLYREQSRPLTINIDVLPFQQNSYRLVKGKYKYSDFVQITISDNGRGFEPKNKINPFQIIRKQDVPYSGLSFGLAICKKIVDNHYGDISLASSKGTGTTVTIVLPLMQQDD